MHATRARQLALQVIVRLVMRGGVSGHSLKSRKRTVTLVHLGAGVPLLLEARRAPPFLLLSQLHLLLLKHLLLKTGGTSSLLHTSSMLLSTLQTRGTASLSHLL